MTQFCSLLLPRLFKARSEYVNVPGIGCDTVLEHIGKGRIGLEGFRFMMNDERFADIPKILETPKDKEMTEDRMNLATLRGLVK